MKHSSDFYSDSDNELPGIEAIFKPLKFTASLPRRSPRKHPHCLENDAKKGCFPTSAPRRQENISSAKESPPKPSRIETKPRSKRPAVLLKDIPNLARTHQAATSTSTRSSASSSQKQGSLKMVHVDSLLLPFSEIALSHADDVERSRLYSRRESLNQTRICEQRDQKRSPMSSILPVFIPPTLRGSSRNPKRALNSASQFVSKEAQCVDDQSDSMNEESEDEDTDLSGFIVDDDAEISFHDSSASENEARKSSKASQPPKSRRRLVRKQLLAHNTIYDDEDGDFGGSDKENQFPITAAKDTDLSKLLKGMNLSNVGGNEIEVVDLTSSPTTSPPPAVGLKMKSRSSSNSAMAGVFSQYEAEDLDLFDNFDTALRFSPPHAKPAFRTSVKLGMTDHNQGQGSICVRERDFESDHARDSISHEALASRSPSEEIRFTTPPATPRRSPSKLKSPSKLLSPSKRADHIPKSPHRQSMDAFWDLEVVNDWNDEYSPHKPPLTSPRKKGLSRFKIWSDDEESEDDSGSRDASESPCATPKRTGPWFPTKQNQQSPPKKEKTRVAEVKKLKREFDNTKENLARELLNELDRNVTAGKLSTLSASTGGVQINWSKNLRSTAGRANWRRTVAKVSGSPVKGAHEPAATSGSQVQHYASIELAEKVIDTPSRLVNTLAHEFCHLANFMVSNVRDQPHGASFRAWAAKVTLHLRESGNAVWKEVEVTTKHSYTINHKYLWVCVGRRSLLNDEEQKFTGVTDEDEGCGGEYGRHSKSIDPERHRCGKCKGMLVQVRPKPRMGARGRGKGGPSPFKKMSKGNGNTLSTGGVGVTELTEKITLVDLEV